MIDRLKSRFAKWKFERRWRKATPSMQIAATMEMLHKSPALRKMFRDALFGKTHEARGPEPRRKNGRKQVPGFR